MKFKYHKYTTDTILVCNKLENAPTKTIERTYFTHMYAYILYISIYDVNEFDLNIYLADYKATVPQRCIYK